MNMKLSLYALPLIASGVIAGCSSDPDEESVPTSSSTFAITTVPPDVRCVKVSITGATRTVEKKYDVFPNQPSVFRTGGLPTGAVVVSAEAYGGTCNATGSTPFWIAAG